MTDASTDQKPRIRLTALSHGAGCACKLGPAELTQVLRHVPGIRDPRVLVDAATATTPRSFGYPTAGRS